MENYLFLVYDCNDESKMKVVGRYKEGAKNSKELDRIANFLLNEEEGETAWLEIYELVGRRMK